jgi:superfamily II DNA or RNA helicase
MISPRNGFPDCAVGIQPSPDPFRPYDHQQAAWDAMDRHYTEKEKRAGILVVPTGGGKTAIAARWLLQRHVRQGGRVLWLTHRRGLLLQAFDAFRKAAHLATPREQLRLIAVSGQDRSWSGVSSSHDIVFSTIQSAAQERSGSFLDQLEHQSPNGLFVIVDEAHHAAAPSYQRVLNSMEKLSCPVLGLTATPVRMDPDDDRRLWKIFREIIFQIPKRALTENGILSSPTIETIKTHVEFEREFTQADYEHLSRFGELASEVLGRIAKNAARNHLIVDHYSKHSEKYGKTIVFAVDTLHAQTLVQEFREQNVDADYVDYTRSDSAKVMNDFRDEPVPRVLVNVEMLTEGYDAPKTKSVFLARPTKSEALLSQMVGRALRGPRAGGTAQAFLVTFVDTWKEFHPLEAEYVVHDGEVDEVVARPNVPTKLVPIAQELILESYKLVRSNVRGDFIGIFQCLPHSWFVWEEEFEDDIQRKTVMVFENQVEGFRQMLERFGDPSSIPDTIPDSLARDLVRQYFGDCQDPLPHWSDIKGLLEARRRSTAVESYTFDEKSAFDPAVLANQIRQRDLGEQAKEAELRNIFNANPVCQLVYRKDMRSFFEDVDRELMTLRDPVSTPDAPALRMDPLAPLRPWTAGEPGYQLGTIWDAVVSQKKHFPGGVPVVRDLHYSPKPLKSHWGWFRYSDKALRVNCVLNSPDVPLFVMEFLVFHEALHADMPNSGHNRDFRQRERRFTPSASAIEDAASRNLQPGRGPEAWYALADQFLGTFEQQFGPAHGGARVMNL